MFPLLKESTHTYFDGIPHTHIQKQKMVDIRMLPPPLMTGARANWDAT
jgi:hypothetical protein